MKEVALFKGIDTTPETVFKEVNIYRTTTVFKKNSRGIWFYEGKIFYQSGHIRAQVFVSGTSHYDLQTKMQVEMRKLKGKK